MSPLQWVGLGFAVALVAFLIVAYFGRENLNSNQSAILRFLCALCGGFAGALITGTALFDLKEAWTGGKIAVSGTAGFALFFVVWYGFNRVAPRGPDRFNMAVPDGWNFRQAATTVAKHDQSVVTFVGFLDAELNAPLSAQVLQTDSVSGALLALRNIVSAPTSVREYGVEFARPTYTLKISV